ncbi:MAG: stage 0 sporulation protein [Candidatus Tectomicrobia bacterium]|nr:stage 0 sporulation protein [Candidatus Tectomicrobia bacterium]
MINVVGVKFRNNAKIYTLTCNDLFDLETGETCIAETEQGVNYGVVALPPRQVEERRVPQPVRSVLRKATPEDIETIEKLSDLDKEALRVCLSRIKELELPMKLVSAEFSFEAKQAVFSFTADGRIDFRELVRDLAHYFKARIEMKQIGVRDEARLIGGYGSCGRPLCCTTFLKDFVPVSMRMVKEQNLALNPSKSSGLCGRLKCCLTYERRNYVGEGAELGGACRGGNGTCLRCGATAKVHVEEGEVVSTHEDWA